MNPIEHPDQYDKLVLCGSPSPGACKLGGVQIDRGWTKQKPKGASGAETVHNGDDLVEFTCEIVMWLPEHFKQWVTWRELLRRPVEKGAPRALDVYHPQLAELGVTSVVCSKEGPVEPSGVGRAAVKLSFLQYSPPQQNSAAGKPGGSAATKQGAKGDDPNQDLKDKVAKLTEEFQSA